MTDVQPDYTPFLNLVRPDTHDDIRTTVNKLRDALDAVDAWAAAQGGGGSSSAPSMALRTVDASTPKDGDGNVALTVDDGTVLVDTTGMDPQFDYVGLSLPIDPPAGFCVRAVRISPDDNVSVYFTTANTDPAGYGGTNGSLFHQFQERTAYWPGEGLVSEGWSISGSAAVALTDLQDFVWSNITAEGIVNVIAFDGSDGKWKVMGIGRPAVEASVNYGPADPGVAVFMDASGGPRTVSLRDHLYSIVTVKKTDSSPNAVNVIAYLGALQIDGASSLALTEQGETVTVIRSQTEWRIIDHVSGLPPSMSLDGLSDVVIGTLNDGDLLQFNGTDGKWEDSAPGSLPFVGRPFTFVAGSPTVNGDADLTGTPAGTWTVAVVDATVRDAVVTMPAPEQGTVISVKKADASAHVVNVVTPGSETIDGAASLVISTQYQSRDLVSDGTNWWVV